MAFYAKAVSFGAHEERAATTPAEEPNMPSNEKLRAGRKLDKSDPEPYPDPWDPYNCPTCRSGVIEYPPAIMADVVNVEL